MRINQLLDVTFQMSPTPLKPFAVEVHFGSIAVQDDSRVVADKRNKRLPRSVAEDDKDGEHRRAGHPQPGFQPLLFGGRFIDKKLTLVFELFAKLFVRFRDRIADEVLNLHRPGGTAWDVQQIFQEHPSSAFALSKVPLQQTGEGGQSRPALSRGDASRQAGLSGAAAAADAMATEQLVFIDEAFDWRQVPDQVPLRISPVRLQVAPTATAAIGMTRRDGGALFDGGTSFDGDEFSRVPLVTFLSALFSFPLYVRMLECSVQGTRYKVQGTRYKAQGTRYTAEWKNCEESVSELDRSEYPPAWSIDPPGQVTPGQTL